MPRVTVLLHVLVQIISPTQGDVQEFPGPTANPCALALRHTHTSRASPRSQDASPLHWIIWLGLIRIPTVTPIVECLELEGTHKDHPSPTPDPANIPSRHHVSASVIQKLLVLWQEDWSCNSFPGVLVPVPKHPVCGGLLCNT